MTELRLPPKNVLGNFIWGEDEASKNKVFIWDVPFKETVSAVLFSKLLLNFIGNEYSQMYGISVPEIGVEHIKVSLPDESGPIIIPTTVLCYKAEVKSFTNHFKGSIIFNLKAVPENHSKEEFLDHIGQVFINLLTMVHVEALKV